MSRSVAEILREYGPFTGIDRVHGLTFDGRHLWFASGDKLNAFDPASGRIVRSIDVAAEAGTAFDGQHLFQLADDRIQKIDPKTGRVIATIPRPPAVAIRGLPGRKGHSGWGRPEAGRSTKSIPKRELFFAPSNPTVSLPASPGSTASSGTALGKATRAT